MKSPFRFALAALTLQLALVGCNQSPAKIPVSAGKAPDKVAQATTPTAVDEDAAKEEADIKAALAKLGDEDRKLALAQGYCAIEDDHRLGTMGTPVKVIVEGKPVFICCKGCKKDVEKEPKKALAKVDELKKKVEEQKKKSEAPTKS
jgi:hypothetical protein